MAYFKILRRNLEPPVREALAHARVVLVNGPRQAGKTTLVLRHYPLAVWLDAMCYM